MSLNWILHKILLIMQTHIKSEPTAEHAESYGSSGDGSGDGGRRIHYKLNKNAILHFAHSLSVSSSLFLCRFVWLFRFDRIICGTLFRETEVTAYCAVGDIEPYIAFWARTNTPEKYWIIGNRFERLGKKVNIFQSCVFFPRGEWL